MEAGGGWVKSMGAWLPWVQKGFWAVLDQGLFSGANFLVNILLARWLEPEEYGAFAVALSVFYLLAGFHTAVLTQPMMVFGAGKYREQFRKYLRILLWGHWGISALIVLGLGGAAWFFLHRGSPLGEALLGLAVASPFLLLLRFARRVPYIEMRPRVAVMMSGGNFLLVFIGVFVLYRLNLLSTLSCLLLLGFCEALSVFAASVLPKAKDETTRNPKGLSIGLVVRDHWEYSKWALGNSVVVWAVGNINYLVLGAYSLEHSGALRALQNLVLPMQQILLALSYLLLPTFAKTVADNSVLNNKVKWSFKTIASLALLYILGITLFRQPLMNVLYGTSYRAYSDFVPLYALILLPATANTVFVRALQARGDTYHVFIGYLVASLTLLVVSVPLIRFYGILGAIQMNIISATITAYLLVHFYNNYN